MSSGAQRRSHVLRTAAADRAASARIAAEAAIAQLLETGTPITFTAVAKSAGVSRKYLYTTADLTQRITQLRDTAPGHGTVDVLRQRLRSEQINAQELRHHNENLETQLRQARVELERLQPSASAD